MSGRRPTPSKAPVPRVSGFATAALAAACLGLYAMLAPPVSGDKDASEFVLALATGGVLHPTGYPLFTLFGHFFVRAAHAMGASFPLAANLWAALGGGAALYFFHRLALRLLPRDAGMSSRARFVLAAVPVLLLAFNPVWMVECTVVEVHSWQLAWLCGTSLYFTNLVERLERDKALDRPGMRMAGWGLLCGLGGALHTTSIFFAGGLSLALTVALIRAQRFGPAVVATWLAAGIVPLASYLGLLYRAQHPGAAQIWPTLEPTFASLVEHVTAQAYRIYVGRFAPDVVQSAWLAWYVYPWLGVGLSLFAFTTLRRGSGAPGLVALALFGSALAQTLFAFNYGVSDPAAYFLPGLVVALLGLGLAAAMSLPALRKVRFGVPIAGVLAVMALAVWGASGVVLMNARRHLFLEADAYLNALWLSIPYDRAIVVWPDDKYYRLEEYQSLRGEKPGLEVVNTASLLNRQPRAQFARKFGFDPLGVLDDTHWREPLHERFVIGSQSTANDTHAYALIHEWLTQKAGIPVVAFDPPKPLRAWVPRPDSTVAR